MDILKIKQNGVWTAIPAIIGPRGIGITSITKTGTSGLTDTYTITFSDNTTTTFTLNNGAVPNLTIGTVTEGATAAATITGTTDAPVLNLVLPNANVPTRVSELENDAGYLTEHQDISGKADKANTVITGSLSLKRKENTSVGTNSIALGNNNEASGNNSFAEGNQTQALLTNAHAEGFQTVASGKQAHTEGSHTIAAAQSSHVSGEYNVEDSYDNWPLFENKEYNIGDKMTIYASQGSRNYKIGYICKEATSGGTLDTSKWISHGEKMNYAEIIGNGTADNARSNAYALTWEGDGKYMGDVYVHANADSTGGSKVLIAADITGKQDTLTFDTTPTASSTNPVTSGGIKSYVDTAVSNINTMKIHICTAQEYNAETGVPTIQNPDTQTLYLVPGGEGNNLFIEWAYVNSAWERFGSADVEVPVQDVQVNGTSIVTNGVANVPQASASAFGVIKHISGSGLTMLGTGVNKGALIIDGASPTSIKPGTESLKPITPLYQHTSVFYGLAKAAGDTTQSQSDNAVGTYTDAAKTAIRSMLGVPATSDIPTKVSDLTDDSGHYTKPAGGIPASDLAAGVIPTVPVTDVQVNGVSVLSNGIANVGLMTGNAQCLTAVTGHLGVVSASSVLVKNGTSGTNPIVPKVQHESVFYGLSKVAGVDLASEAVTLGTYPETSKTAIRTMLGAIGDVQVNGTSVVSNGVANVPKAGESTFGAVRVSSSTAYGVIIGSDGILRSGVASDAQTKAGTFVFGVISPARQHLAAFYGLAKAAGHDEKDSTESLGTYTPAAKAAIQQMLGVSDLIATAEPTLVASKAYAIGDVFTANGKLYKATAAIAANDTIVLQNEGETISGANAVESTIANELDNTWTKNDFKFNSLYGLEINNAGYIVIHGAGTTYIKAGVSYGEPILPTTQHYSTFYGLAKAAGADEKDSTLPVGQYTDTAKTAIRTMLGAVGDVQVNGTSVVSSGVANIPLATASVFGAVKLGDSFSTDSSSKIILARASDAQVKAGTNNSNALVPLTQHHSVFYGLAKAAGDTTQSTSSNTVGTYTDSAKASIKQMLGIVDGSTGTVDISGAAPSITAVENTRYVCGEVTSLSFTPAANGICIVRFTSGSTATLLTVPNTVKFPEWFDPTSLETNTIYEICITDGVYGAVMLWAL